MNYEELTPDEVLNVLTCVPDAVIVQLRRSEERLVLAGGIVRDTVAGLPWKDLDIFCHSAEQAERLALEVSPFVKHTTFAYSVVLNGVPVQYVFYKDFDGSCNLISQFDFRACCAGITWSLCEEWIGIAVQGFHADCKAKVLNFMSQLKDAGKLTALARALNLAGKGWTLSTNEAARIVSHFAPTLDPIRVAVAFRPGYGGRV